MLSRPRPIERLVVTEAGEYEPGEYATESESGRVDPTQDPAVGRGVPGGQVPEGTGHGPPPGRQEGSDEKNLEPNGGRPSELGGERGDQRDGFGW